MINAMPSIPNFVVPPLGRQFYDYNPHRTQVYGPENRPAGYTGTSYGFSGYGTYKSTTDKSGTGGNMAKRSASRTKRKRPSKRPRRRGVIRRRIPRALTTRSKVISCKADNYVNFTGTGAITAFTAQLNSCDDPYATSVAETGQPLGYDQWKALYKRAVVLSSRITITWHNRGTTAVICGIWPAPLNQGTTTLTNYEYYNEVPGNVRRLLSPEMDHGVLSAARSTKRHLQVTNVRDNAELSIDLVNETPPSKLAHWHFYAQAVDQTSAFAVDAVVTIHYTVLLLDPVIPARSIET